jgi:hypothetical protein
MPDYNKSIGGSSTYDDDQTVSCDNANITVHEASTAHFGDLICEGSATLTAKADGLPGTMTIDNLTCEAANLTVLSGATLVIGSIACKGHVSLNVDNAATLKIEKGYLDTISGPVNNSSTLICTAAIENGGTSDIDVENSSTVRT